MKIRKTNLVSVTFRKTNFEKRKKKREKNNNF